MIEVLERVGHTIDDRNHPETMAVFKLGRDHEVPPARWVRIRFKRAICEPKRVARGLLGGSRRLLFCGRFARL
jgi:hypothetical protein